MCDKTVTKVTIRLYSGMGGGVIQAAHCAVLCVEYTDRADCEIDREQTEKILVERILNLLFT